MHACPSLRSLSFDDVCVVQAGMALTRSGNDQGSCRPHRQSGSNPAPEYLHDHLLEIVIQLYSNYGIKQVYNQGINGTIIRVYLRYKFRDLSASHRIRDVTVDPILATPLSQDL